MTAESDLLSNSLFFFRCVIHYRPAMVQNTGTAVMYIVLKDMKREIL